MWELDYKESWEPKNWCFWTVVLEKILESPLDCKEIQPVHSKGNQLKLQYFGHLMQRLDSLEKILMLGKIEGRRRRGWERMRWMASPTQWTWVWVGSGSWWWTGKPGVLQSMGLQRFGHDWATELNWSHVSSFVTPWAVAHHLSIGFLRPEYWSTLSFPSPVDFPNPGIEPTSPALARGFFTTDPQEKPSLKLAEIILIYVFCFFFLPCLLPPLSVLFSAIFAPSRPFPGA